MILQEGTLWGLRCDVCGRFYSSASATTNATFPDELDRERALGRFEQRAQQDVCVVCLALEGKFGLGARARLERLNGRRFPR
jgi:hypothetical protein